MSAVVREKKKGSGEWWVFIRHQGRRGSKKIGSSKTKALAVADIINIRLALSQVGLDLCRPGKKAPPLLKLEHIRQLKRCLAGTPKRAIPSEIPSWVLEIVEHQVLWEGVAAHRRGEKAPVYTREEILEAAVDLAETHGTRKKYDRSQEARTRVDNLIRGIAAVKPEPVSGPRHDTKPGPEKPTEDHQEKFPTESHENFSKPDPKPPARQRRSQKGDALEKGIECCLGNKGQILLQALPAQSPKPKRERILYEQTRKRKEYKEALRKRYSPRMEYGPVHDR